MLRAHSELEKDQAERHMRNRLSIKYNQPLAGNPESPETRSSPELNGNFYSRNSVLRGPKALRGCRFRIIMI